MKTKLCRMNIDGTNNMELAVTWHDVKYDREWLYFQNALDGFKLYKLSADGSKIISISDEDRCYLEAITEDWLVYSTDIGTEGLYKINKDGTNKILLDNNSHYSYIKVFGDWIYYVKWRYKSLPSGSINPFNEGVFKVSKDGKMHINIVNDIDDLRSDYLKVEDWIVYTSKNDHKLYKVKDDGTGEKYKISDDPWAEVVFSSGEWIYYRSHYSEKTSQGTYIDNYIPYKIRIDGTGKIKLSKEQEMIDINILNGKTIRNTVIYSDNMGKLFRIGIDGRGKVLIDEAVNFVNIAGDWVYYCKYGADGSNLGRYATNIDGTTKFKVMVNE